MGTKIHSISFKKMCKKCFSEKDLSFCLGLKNVIKPTAVETITGMYNKQVVSEASLQTGSQ